MFLSRKEYWNINLDRILFNKLFYELKYWFLVYLLGLLSSIEVTNFSSQLSFFLAKLKTDGIYVYVTSLLSNYKGKTHAPFNFSYKGISTLYLLYVSISNCGLC